MAYSDHFKLADDLILHLDATLAALHDPFIESRYTGFLAVSSTAVLELAMKNIFCDCADKKHKVFGNFCADYFKRINGRIGVDFIMKDYLAKFGAKYQQRFKDNLDKLELHYLSTTRSSIKESYKNLIRWRNAFAHEGNIPAYATYAEVKQAYMFGKEVMHCLARCMQR